MPAKIVTGLQDLPKLGITLPDTDKPRPHVSAAGTTATGPTADARAVRRMIYLALEDAYSEAGRRYKQGHNDATVAKVAECHENAVAKVREEFFGPAEPPLPHEVAELIARVGKVEEWVSKVRADLDALVAAHGWQLP